jgi:hypothetical protein
MAVLGEERGPHSRCALLARELSKESFQQAVERELTGKRTEPWEIVYFKLYESEIPVIDRALETAALMLGSDRSRGYCLEMIRGLSGRSQSGQWRSGDTAVLDDEILQISIRRAEAGFLGLPRREVIMSSTNSDYSRWRFDRESYEGLRQQVLHRDGWGCQSCGTTDLEVHHQQFHSLRPRCRRRPDHSLRPVP